jgi:hypothetical protein
MQPGITHPSCLRVIMEDTALEPNLCQVLEAMLEWDPSKRASIRQVLAMPYCQLRSAGGLVPQGPVRLEQVERAEPLKLPKGWAK